MKYGYKEVKKISAEKIRGLCIAKNWFTEGTNEEYDELLQYGFSCKEITTDDLVEMATLIFEHSDEESLKDYEYTSVMWELNNICYSYFEEC